ncbi:hypothetical protein I4U23_006264 [Adineta vaga]|nr:hypothetical protein I4U23_006264 [Adineta vaga]
MKKKLFWVTRYSLGKTLSKELFIEHEFADDETRHRLIELYTSTRNESHRHLILATLALILNPPIGLMACIFIYMAKRQSRHIIHRRTSYKQHETANVGLLCNSAGPMEGRHEPNGNFAHEQYCNRYYICQNNLRYSIEKNECDCEDKVDCKGREKLIDTEGLDDEVRPGSNNTRGRSTQYCTRGLVWRQDIPSNGHCNWSKERSTDGADCNGKALEEKEPFFYYQCIYSLVILLRRFFVKKLAEYGM